MSRRPHTASAPGFSLFPHPQRVGNPGLGVFDVLVLENLAVGLGIEEALPVDNQAGGNLFIDDADIGVEIDVQEVQGGGPSLPEPAPGGRIKALGNLDADLDEAGEASLRKTLTDYGLL